MGPIKVSLPVAMKGSEIAKMLEEAAQKCSFHVRITSEIGFIPEGKIEKALNYAINIDIPVPFERCISHESFVSISCQLDADRSYREIGFGTFVRHTMTPFNKMITPLLWVCGLLPGLVWFIKTDHCSYSVNSSLDPRFGKIKPCLHSFIESFYREIEESSSKIFLDEGSRLLDGGR